jgi:hypothetical protein
VKAQKELAALADQSEDEKVGDTEVTRDWEDVWCLTEGRQGIGKLEGARLGAMVVRCSV